MLSGTPSQHIPGLYGFYGQNVCHLLSLSAPQANEDKVERALLSLAADRRPVQASGETEVSSHSAEWDTLAAPDWPGVPETAMLLSPSRCRALWRQFTSDTNFIVQQVGCSSLLSWVCPDQVSQERGRVLGQKSTNAKIMQT